LSTKLRLLVDECVPADIAERIQNSSGVSSAEIITAKHPLGNRGASDDEVVAYAKKHHQILVTIESRLDERKYTICTHEGIIVINATNRHEWDKAELFEQLMQSGFRSKCCHAVTKLRLNNSVRLERDEDNRAVRSVPLNFR